MQEEEKKQPRTLKAAFQTAKLRSDAGTRPRVLALITKGPQIQSAKLRLLNQEVPFTARSNDFSSDSGWKRISLLTTTCSVRQEARHPWLERERRKPNTDNKTLFFTPE